ncbi:hypothetical protein KIN20_011395 [Parelaphostrongylus tenuis]|uniref:Uncharacterized protein n=1 Tax=Parelaphostrongylus tenuis TaxID=148309 RepID=A0AAD5ME13_PARTN|nr:hypothetical protein KIN20_011395 [Parelaphostrongylus tenuis]
MNIRRRMQAIEIKSDKKANEIVVKAFVQSLKIAYYKYAPSSDYIEDISIKDVPYCRCQHQSMNEWKIHASAKIMSLYVGVRKEQRINTMHMELVISGFKESCQSLT